MKINIYGKNKWDINYVFSLKNVYSFYLNSEFPVQTSGNRLHDYHCMDMMHP